MELTRGTDREADVYVCYVAGFAVQLYDTLFSRGFLNYLLEVVVHCAVQESLTRFISLHSHPAY